MIQLKNLQNFVLVSLQSLLNKKLHELRNKNRRFKLSNRRFTLVANNCVAGSVYQDLRLEYQTPFVGLYIMPKDFVKLCASFEYYMGIQPIEKDCPEFSFPVGEIEEVTIYFMHYKNFDEALSKWNARVSRIDFRQLGFILVQRDNCTEEDLQFFDSLNLTNRIILTSSPMRHLKSSFFLKIYSHEKEVGNVLEYKNAYSGERIFWDFNFVKWINSFH